MNYELSTTCVHGGPDKPDCDRSGAVSVPIYQSATFAHPELGVSTGYDYSRLSNPTRDHLQTAVAALEGGSDCFAFSTGMAAITALMELFSPGDHIISGGDLYGGAIRLFHKINAKNGVTHTFLSDVTPETLSTALTPQTRAIYVETPTNPMMQVTDLQAVSAFAKAHGLLLFVDNTFLSPYFQNPLALGADVVIHSGTKFLGGHNDTLAGFLVTNNKALAEQLAVIYKTTGACLSPFDSWLILRGLKTLALRMECQQKNALELAEFLKQQQKVTAVYYPGLKEHPSYEISCRQSRGFGSMITFETDCTETARELLRKVKLITFAESLGGVETLITYPMTQTHAELSEEERRRNGITDRILRLSVGIEAIEDLKQDLTQALQ
ncbi:MAG: trans-sulfuration enzyme family protein [Lachnospiraceae bacterium]